MEELIIIQNALKVGKNNSNKDIRFKYRTTDQILEHAKPLCQKQGVLLFLTDSVEQVGEFNYVKSTATVIKGDKSISCDGWAKEPLKLMSMSAPQITGSASSYARKTALGGLFCLDDNQDPDSGNGKPNEKEATAQQYQEINNIKVTLTPQQQQWVNDKVNGGLTFEEAEMVLKNIKGAM